MRLIDADWLFENLDGMMAVSPTGYIHGDTVADMISDAPTVDAVPLEWIKRRIEGLNVQAENSTDDNKWADFAREAFALEKIVKFWAERKEE